MRIQLKSLLTVVALAFAVATPAQAHWRPFGGLFAGIFRGLFCGGGYHGGYYGGGYYSGPRYSSGYGDSGAYCSNNGGGFSRQGSYAYSSVPSGYEGAPPQDRAYIFIHGIPAGAKFLADGHDFSRPGTAADYRVFKTPSLKPGRYHTTFQVEYQTQKGETASGKAKVEYHTGTRVRLNVSDFDFKFVARNPVQPPPPDTEVIPPGKKEPATIELDMPAEARIYIDGKLIEGKGEAFVRKMRTPVLDPKKQYVYNVRVEHSLDGEATVATRQLKFRAGDHLVLGLDQDDATKVAVSLAPQAVSLAGK